MFFFSVAPQTSGFKQNLSCTSRYSDVFYPSAVSYQSISFKNFPLSEEMSLNKSELGIHCSYRTCVWVPTRTRQLRPTVTPVREFSSSPGCLQHQAEYTRDAMHVQAKESKTDKSKYKSHKPFPS